MPRVILAFFYFNFVRGLKSNIFQCFFTQPLHNLFPLKRLSPGHVYFGFCLSNSSLIEAQEIDFAYPPLACIFAFVCVWLPLSKFSSVVFVLYYQQYPFPCYFPVKAGRFPTSLAVFMLYYQHNSLFFALNIKCVLPLCF